MNNIKRVYLIHLSITIIIELYTIAFIKSLEFQNLIIKSIIIFPYNGFSKNTIIIYLYIA